ncbi:MAG: hypothetical protein HOV67_33895, partial [Kribbellaceae bacterium]|nr:hypothetical protein [Kribbellaceae bacterium]
PPERAANELTVTDWDPCSKQPLFKSAAANAERIALGNAPSAAPTTTASKPAGGGIRRTVGGIDAMVVEDFGASVAEGNR